MHPESLMPYHYVLLNYWQWERKKLCPGSGDNSSRFWGTVLWDDFCYAWLYAYSLSHLRCTSQWPHIFPQAPIPVTFLMFSSSGDLCLSPLNSLDSHLILQVCKAERCASSGLKACIYNHHGIVCSADEGGSQAVIKLPLPSFYFTLFSCPLSHPNTLNWSLQLLRYQRRRMKYMKAVRR